MQDINLIKSKLDRLVGSYSETYEEVSFSLEKKYLKYALVINQKPFVISCSTGVGVDAYFNLDLEVELGDGSYGHRASEYPLSEIDREIKLVQTYIDSIVKNSYTITKDRWLFFVKNTYLEVRTNHATYRMIKSRGSHTKSLVR